MHKLLRIAVIASVAATVAACGGGGGDNSVSGPPVVVQTPRQEDQFGANFGTAFRADATAAPTTPADGDIAPLSLTTEPVPVG